ncbi:MAG: FAD-dependent oxidoreductase, partial [Thermoplasmatales archaeon]
KIMIGKSNKIILGAGITGLAAGLIYDAPVYEALDRPGGICSSYYIQPGKGECLARMPEDGEAYRFEKGGGHWIFGTNNEILKFLEKFTYLKHYKRLSSVYFSKGKLYAPYPIQNNIRFLDDEITEKVLDELSNKSNRTPSTMKEWLVESFGSTLCDLFFFPFHELYTTRLYEKIAPQDNYKTPVDISLVVQGAKGEVSPVGYNATFVYPEGGLNVMAQRMAERCDINYEKRVVKIDIKKKEVYFEDRSIIGYKILFSTLPLNKMMEMTDIMVGTEPDPYTSVLVLNIGATRGDNCPDDHWVYVPDSKSGFFRVGFYSNVDVSFIPKSSQMSGNRVSIYVERSYQGGQKPSEPGIRAYSDSVVNELKKWNFIKDIEVVDPTWIDVAYTWGWPGSGWRQQSLDVLEKYDIYQLGRYGRWKFQGIADSVKDVLLRKRRL